MSKKRIGVVGCGQWGPNHIRTFFFHPQTDVVRICDKDTTRLAVMKGMYPFLNTSTDYKEITRAADIDAVIITTPVSSHFEIAQDALTHGKDVFCEKPLTITSKDSIALATLAQEKGCILMVGHVFLFNTGIIELKKRIDAGEIGDLYYLHAVRTNLGPVRADANAVYDLASHDISIFNYLLGSTPKVLSATGKCYLQKRVEDVAFISLEYPGNILAHIHVSWLDPKKVRQITIVGKDKMLSWDDLSSRGPVEIYSKHVERFPTFRGYGEFYLSVKEGETVIPTVKNIEPLRLQADHFVDCIVSRKAPLADAISASQVVKTLEEIEKVLDVSR